MPNPFENAALRRVADRLGVPFDVIQDFDDFHLEIIVTRAVLGLRQSNDRPDGARSLYQSSEQACRRAFQFVRTEVMGQPEPAKTYALHSRYGWLLGFTDPPAMMARWRPGPLQPPIARMLFETASKAVSAWEEHAAKCGPAWPDVHEMDITLCALTPGTTDVEELGTFRSKPRERFALARWSHPKDSIPYFHALASASAGIPFRYEFDDVPSYASAKEAFAALNACNATRCVAELEDFVAVTKDGKRVTRAECDGT